MSETGPSISEITATPNPLTPGSPLPPLALGAADGAEWGTPEPVPLSEVDASGASVNNGGDAQPTQSTGREVAQDAGGEPSSTAATTAEAPPVAEIPPVRDRVNGLLTDAVRILADKKDTFGTDADRVLKMDQALSFSTREGQTPRNLKSMFESLGYLQTTTSDQQELAELSRIYDGLSENVTVLFEGRLYLLKALKAEGADSKTSADRQTEIKKIMSEGEYAFDFDPARSQLNLAVDRNIADLQKTIDDRRAKKQSTEVYEEILKSLKLAQGFEGNTRAFFQVAALRRLRGSGLSLDPAGLEQAINGSTDVYNQAQEALIMNALDQGYTPEQAKFIVTSLAQGDFEGLKRVGFFNKPGVDKLLFGREVSDAEMAKLLGLLGDKKRKFGKDEALMALLMAVVGVTQATKQAVMGEIRR